MGTALRGDDPLALKEVRVSHDTHYRAVECYLPCSRLPLIDPSSSHHGLCATRLTMCEQVITLVHQRAGEQQARAVAGATENLRVKFMLETLRDLKNNKRKLAADSFQIQTLTKTVRHIRTTKGMRSLSSVGFIDDGTGEGGGWSRGMCFCIHYVLHPSSLWFLILMCACWLGGRREQEHAGDFAG